jgi:hypothetical protein
MVNVDVSEKYNVSPISNPLIVNKKSQDDDVISPPLTFEPAFILYCKSPGEGLFMYFPYTFNWISLPVGVILGVIVGVTLGVIVGVTLGVKVGVELGVGDKPCVGVTLGVFVLVGVIVGVIVGVAVLVGVTLGVGVDVKPGVWVTVGVTVFVGVIVGVFVGVTEGNGKF